LQHSCRNAKIGESWKIVAKTTKVGCTLSPGRIHHSTTHSTTHSVLGMLIEHNKCRIDYKAKEEAYQLYEEEAQNEHTLGDHELYVG
jgi:hypothetical protein